MSLSFAAILLLFAVNIALYFWSSQRRNHTVEALDRAISRQIVIANAKQDLDNLHKQVALLGQVNIESEAGGVSEDDVAEFTRQLDRVAKQIEKIKSLSEPGTSAGAEELEKTYRELAESWKIFYSNFGRNQGRALVELAVRGDPLSDRVLRQLLPRIQEEEQQRADAAKARFSEVSRTTDRLTVLIFLLSSLTAALLAVRVSRYLSDAVGDLVLGTALIGSGKLDHRIPVRPDELGILAGSFNDMASSLDFIQRKLQERTQELEKTNREMAEKNEQLAEQKRISEGLLLNILPADVAQELHAKGLVDPKYFEDVTILFTDFVGFTASSEQLAADTLVAILHEFFTAFDRIVKQYGLEKLKTIGDSYMAVGGLPRKTSSHPVDAVLAAFDLVQTVQEQCARGTVNWRVRVGIHTGPVVAGVVGIDKFAFDIWGDTVNFASRLESTGQPNRVNISSTTHSRVKDFFECEYRGKIATKEKKEFDMYFVKEIHPELRDGAGAMPSPGFLRRYQIYFSKQPPAFPIRYFQALRSQVRT